MFFVCVAVWVLGLGKRKKEVFFFPKVETDKTRLIPIFLVKPPLSTTCSLPPSLCPFDLPVSFFTSFFFLYFLLSFYSFLFLYSPSQVLSYIGVLTLGIGDALVRPTPLSLSPSSFYQHHHPNKTIIGKQRLFLCFALGFLLLIVFVSFFPLCLLSHFSSSHDPSFPSDLSLFLGLDHRPSVRLDSVVRQLG